MRKLLFQSDYDYTLEDYIEYLKDMGKYDESKIYEEDDKFHDWVYDMQERDNEDIWIDLAYPAQKGAFIITGTLGLWNGHPDIEPVLCPDLKSAIEKCVFGGSIIDFEIYYDDGHYEVYAHHHDGTNCFELHQLTKKGQLAAMKKELNCESMTFAKSWEKRIPEKNPWLF